VNVLVIGGAGYIGSVVTQQLVQAGHRAVAYDNLSYGHRDAVVPEADWVVADLADLDTLAATIRRYRIEAVIHLAGSSQVGDSMLHPAKYFRDNLVTGLGLLDILRACNVRRLVFSSTAAVYGEPDSVPLAEAAPQRPANPYGESKLALERALPWYESAYGLRHVSLRYFNAAGASGPLGEDHRPETHLIPLVLGCAAGQRPEIEIYGDRYPTPDGTCIRDYVHVVDLARAHLLALDAIENGSRIYNVGCGTGYSVREVIETARSITGRPIPTRVRAARPGDPAVLVASSERIRQQLGWEPLFKQLEAIIESAWIWHREHPSGYAA